MHGAWCPQGSVLGLLLFLLFINYFLEGLPTNCHGKLYADDTKLISILKSVQDQIALQTALDHLVAWSKKWLVKFNVSKCKVMHVGKNNPHSDYTMRNTDQSETPQSLMKTELEKDLGVYVSNTMKWDYHIDYASGKANKMLGFIKHSFEYLNGSSMKLLFKSLVRPQLEYGATIWNPWSKGASNKSKLEKVQQK